MTNSDAVITWRRRVKLKGIELLGGKCEICGYNKCVGALQFHHKDPKEKEFRISGISISWDKIKTELAKCALLCANCHMEIHHSGNDIPDLLIPKIEMYCSSCGKRLKTLNAKVCKACFIPPTKIVWNEVEIIKLLTANKSMLAVSKILKVSDNAVRKFCVRSKIDYKALLKL
jgi:hypothetical protein